MSFPLRPRCLINEQSRKMQEPCPMAEFEAFLIHVKREVNMSSFQMYVCRETGKESNSSKKFLGNEDERPWQ